MMDSKKSQTYYGEKAAEDIFPPKKREGRFGSLEGENGLLFPKKSFLAPVLNLDTLHANIECYLNDFHKMVDNVFMSHGSSLLNSVGKTNDYEFPAVRIYQTEKEKIIEVEVPGLDREDINVSVTGEKVIVSGEKKQKYKDESTESIRYGKFYREFQMEGVSIEQATSSLDKGILKITVPLKKERDGPDSRKLTIN